MKMLLKVDIPHEPFNTPRAGRRRPWRHDRTRSSYSLKPQAAYFTEQDGRRGAVLLIEVRQPLRRPPVRRAGSS